MSSLARAEWQCSDILLSFTPPNEKLQDIPQPFWRFALPISIKDLVEAPHLRFWVEKINKPTHWFSWHFLKHKTRDFFHEFYLSKDGQHVVGHSTNNVLFIYEASSRRLLREIDLNQLKLTNNGDFFRIISLSNNHLVIASETALQLRHDDQRQLQRFFPSHLWVLSFEGKVSATHHLEQVLKYAALDSQEKSLLVMEADHFSWETFTQVGDFSLNHILHQIPTHFTNNDHLILQTFLLSEDSQFLYVGAISNHGRESRVLLLDVSQKNTPQILWSVQTPFHKIYTLKKDGDQLIVSGLLKKSEEPLEFTISPPK